jgi:hypothetical protein
LSGMSAQNYRWLGRAARWTAAGVLLYALPALGALGGLPRTRTAGDTEQDSVSTRSATKSSQSPAYQIAVGPLGFSAPGANYLGQRVTLVSLDFMDENRLLFTFRVPGLIQRTAGSSEERQIRAVVLALPSGRVESEALWTLHGRSRYLWMLKDGSFLLRDGEDLKKGDTSLELKPFLHFPGPLLWLETDPQQQYLAAGSSDSAASKRNGATAAPASEGGATGQTKAADSNGEAGKSEKSDLVVRILRRDSGKVMLASRAQSVARLPINSDGYLESLRSWGIEWQVNLHSFTGGITPLGRLDSTCAPTWDFISQRELVATTCNPQGGHRLVAMASDGRILWEEQLKGTDLWPRLIPSPDGSRLARETLIVSHEVNASSPLTTDDIKGQSVEIFDAANGKIVLTVSVSPVLDGGGNVAISPSGRRAAMLNAGFIQIFELPAPLSAPDVFGNQTLHQTTQ